MNALGLAGLLVGLSSTSMSLFVLIKGRGNRINNIWAFYSFCVAIWGFSAFQISNATNINSAYFWWKSAFFGLLFLPPSFYHFVSSYLKKDNRKLIVASYFSAFVLLFFNMMSKTLFLGELSYVFNEFFWICSPGPLLHFFIISSIFGLISYTYYLLFASFFEDKDDKKHIQIFYFLIGSLPGWVGGYLCFLLCYGVKLYPYGAFGAVIYPFVMGYAIVHHQLFDIDIIIKKTLVYSIIIAVITTLYLVIVYLLEKIFSTIAGYHSISTTIMIITFFSLIFIPLKNKIQLFVDKYFFHGTIDKIDEENIRLREEIQKTEKLKAVAALAAGMAHEIKNPLTSIKTFTEYIPEKKNDPEFMDKFHAIVSGEVDRINYTVKQLLEFSKPSELKLQESDVNGLLDETLSLLNNDLVKKNIKTERSYSPLPRIRIDPSQIKQVFLNLFLNSIESMDTGGTITVSTASKADYVSITIRDTGKGIEKENIKHIFDPFFSRKEDGTGLGLSVVHGIVEKHGGKIRVKSPAEAGTSFILDLPA